MDTHRHLTPDGIELYARRWPATGSATATMLLVHGVSEHSGRWDHVARFFTAAGFEVHGYDLRGHGMSGGPQLDVERFDEHVADAAIMVGKVRSQLPLVIYGHSMGGLITTLYAESDHAQPDLYVLSAPALGADVAPPLRMAASVFGRVAPGLRMGTGIEGSQLSRDPRVGEAYFSDPLVYLKGTARFGAALLGAMPRAAAAVDDIRIPTLVIHGGDDTIVPVAASVPLAGVAGVERRVWPGLRHEMHNEPEQNEVLGFVAGWLEARLGEQR